jgi:hypothetical protein
MPSKKRDRYVHPRIRLDRELLQLPRNRQRHGNALVAQDAEGLGHGDRRQQHVLIGPPELGEGVHPGGRLQLQVPPIPGDIPLGDPHPGRASAHGGFGHRDPSVHPRCLAGDVTAG